MPHPFIDIAHLNTHHADRFRQEASLLHGTVNLPDSPAVRAEIGAMLAQAEQDRAILAPRRRRAGLTSRIRAWIPRWFGWLRTMPMP